MPVKSSKDFDFGVMITEIRNLGLRFEEFRTESREHTDRIYERFEKLPDRFVLLRDFEQLKHDVQGIAAIAHSAAQSAATAISKNEVTNAGIAPWRAVIYIVLAAVAGAAANAVFHS